MSGHSFGALTAQAVSGQKTSTGRATFSDSRIAAALMMSPNSPSRGTPEQAFGDVAIPWMLMTGTEDVAPIGHADVASRLAVFPALPAGGKYEVVLYGAEHSAFTDRALPGDRHPRNPNHHRAILALSTAFWDAYLRKDVAARQWLDGEGPKSVLESRDLWQKK
jgi:predicted dienelactone hydrolase